MPIRVGQEIKIQVPANKEEKSRRKKFTVTKIFPGCVIAVDSYGHRRGFSIGDLVINKVIVSGERLR